MAKENPVTGFDQNVEFLALFRARRVNLEDMGENDAALIAILQDRMEEDRKYAARVRLRESQICAEGGHKTALFQEEELGKAKKHSVRKKDTPAVQPRLWQEKLPNTRVFAHDEVISPELKLEQTHRASFLSFLRDRTSPAAKDVKHQQTERRDDKVDLRDNIGLPIVRGKDPRVNDGAYKYLVRKIVEHDPFGIFQAYESEVSEIHAMKRVRISEKLKLQIADVKGYVESLQKFGLYTRGVWHKLDLFVDEFKQKYDVD